MTHKLCFSQQACPPFPLPPCGLEQLLGVSRALACVLVAALAVTGSANAAKLKPSSDGMSLSGIFHAKLGKMHAKMGSDGGPLVCAFICQLLRLHAWNA
jgi:hypothetical protein